MSQDIQDYKIITATNPAEIERIRSAWEGMQTHPNSDIDHFLNVIRTQKHVLRPHVILLNRRDDPVALVAGRIENLSFDLKLGYQTICRPAARCFTIIHQGLLGDLPEDHCSLLLREFIRVLRTGQADVMRLNYLGTSSKMYELATTIPGVLSRDRLSASHPHWRMSVPESMEAFYRSRSRKHRYWLRRMERVLDKEYPDEVKYVTYKDDRDLDTLFADVEAVARKTYQRGLGVGFFDREEARRIYSFTAKMGRLYAYMTYVKNEPRAFWLGELYGDTFYLYSTGYDPKFKKFELGTVLFLKLLEDLCKLGNVRYLDFGFGDGGYKRRFGDTTWREATVYIFSTKFRGLKINALRLLITGTHVALARLLRRLNLLEKARMAWRRKRV